MNIKSLFISFLVAIFLFIVARPTFAQLTVGEIYLDTSLDAGTVKVGTEPNNNGYSQIYYELGGKKTFITDANYPNADPYIDGDYISWMAQIDGVWQIFLYHIPTQTSLRLSGGATNADPQISDGKVVWEGQVAGVWQIYLFDGVKIIQLTDGDMSINPRIDGNFIAYSRKDISGTYRSVVYSINENKAKEITVGVTSKNPRIADGKISFVKDDKEEIFPLTIDDMFVLDLDPLAVLDVPQTVTIAEIEQELLQVASDFEVVPVATSEAQLN